MKTYSNFLSHFSNFLFEKKLKHLILHVTNHCNFRCSHCFVDSCNKFRLHNLDLLLIKNASIIHQDRKGFIEFLNHQLEWGKHHYYLRYKKLLFKNNKFTLCLFFLFFYPLIIFFISLIMTYYTIVPWTKKNFLFLLNFLPIYMIYLIKNLSTYLEFFKDMIKINKISI